MSQRVKPERKWLENRYILYCRLTELWVVVKKENSIKGVLETSTMAQGLFWEKSKSYKPAHNSNDRAVHLWVSLEEANMI